jgi:hypothetical protein
MGLLELTANGELVLSGGSGNGFRFAEFGAANNPSGWAGVLRVKAPRRANPRPHTAVLESLAY